MSNDQYHKFLEHVKNHEPGMPGKADFVSQVLHETECRSNRMHRNGSVLFRWTGYRAVRYAMTGAAAACLILFAVQNAILFDRVQKVENQIIMQQQNPMSLHQVSASQIESFLQTYGSFRRSDRSMDELLEQNHELRRFLRNHPEVKKMMEEETSLFDGVPKVSL